MSIGPEPQARWVGNTLAEFERDLADNLCYQRGTTAESASAQDAYWTLAVTVRDRLADRRARTARANHAANPKFVYYLSAEYMLGRQLRQNTLYTGTADLARQAVAASGYSAEDLEALDVEPGLGNGGLGRLAACLLDSLATLDVPAVGYGIRVRHLARRRVLLEADGQAADEGQLWRSIELVALRVPPGPVPKRARSRGINDPSRRSGEFATGPRAPASSAPRPDPVIEPQTICGIPCEHG